MSVDLATGLPPAELPAPGFEMPLNWSNFIALRLDFHSLIRGRARARSSRRRVGQKTGTARAQARELQPGMACGAENLVRAVDFQLVSPTFTLCRVPGRLARDADEPRVGHISHLLPLRPQITR